MPTLSRKFGTFVLEDTPNGITAEKLSSRVLVSTEFEARQQGHGSLFTSQAFEGCEVSIGGRLHGSTGDEARARLDALVAALTNGEQYLQVHADRRILCRLSKDVDWDVVEGMPLSGFEWSATFRSRWPTWEAVTPTTDTFDWTTSVQFQVLAANAGSAEAWPRIVLTENGPGFSGRHLIIVNTSTDQQLSIQGVTMNSGQSFSIDMREGRIHDGLGGEAESLGVEGSFFPLPAGGASTLELQTNIAVPDFGVVVERNHQYWAP